MAGLGKRMRPHTLTTPKPLLPIAGKPMVERLVEDIKSMTDQKIDQIGFVIGNFGSKAEEMLLSIAEKAGAKGRIFHQEEPLGTAHAINCATELLTGPVMVAFADTLFRTDYKISPEKDGVVWVSKIKNPDSFGVVKI